LRGVGEPVGGRLDAVGPAGARPAAQWRITRLTNAFSKKLENHEHAIALYFFAYNFIFRHGTLRMPPALKAGVTDHWWTYEELVDLIDRADRDNTN
jgi:hypothetical protein